MPTALTHWWRALWLASVLALAGGPAVAAGYDVLDLPAVATDHGPDSLVYTIRKFGDRHFATGHRGHILFSDDAGATWTQAEVPVRSSLLDIDFPTPELGWAVGHEGVILHSVDGGRTWQKQFDGRRYGSEGLAYYEKLAAQEPDNEDYQALVGEMEFAIEQGPDKPLFRVHFHTPAFGHAAGAYGMILRTDNAGQTWEPVLHHVENDSFYHLFDFAPLPAAGRFFICGEAGLFLVGDINERVARRVHSVPWEGSFFTCTNTADGSIVAGGLRGHMYRTDDAGQTWVVVQKPQTSAIASSTRLGDGRLVAAGVGGEILLSADNGLSFTQLPQANGFPVYTVAEGAPGSLLVGGPRGIRRVELPQ